MARKKGQAARRERRDIRKSIRQGEEVSQRRLDEYAGKRSKRRYDSGRAEDRRTERAGEQYDSVEAARGFGIDPDSVGNLESSFRGIDLQSLPGLDAQNQALAQLQGLGTTGQTDMEKFQYLQQQKDAAQKARGAMQATQQNMAARGMGGGGSEIGLASINNQNLIGNLNQNVMQDRAMREQRALAAMQGAGAMGANMSNAAFGRQATKASAQDQINQFNQQSKLQAGGMLADAGANQASAAAQRGQDRKNRRNELIGQGIGAIGSLGGSALGKNWK